VAGMPLQQMLERYFVLPLHKIGQKTVVGPIVEVPIDRM
jgi:hypothetical protein